MKFKQTHTPKKGTIVVLEDSEERVTWLKKVLPQYKILAFVDVASFVKAVTESLTDLKLVIFDHDLGHSRPPDGMYSSENDMLLRYDEDGKTGHDAAHEVPKFDVPALVWSHNVSGRKSIAMTLFREDKASWIQEAPFRDHIDYVAVVGKMLR